MENNLYRDSVIRITPSVQNKAKRGNGGNSANRGCCTTDSSSSGFNLQGNSSDYPVIGSSRSNSNSAHNADSAIKHDSKRQKMDWDLEAFDKLNPDDNGQRISSRYKMILKGKNTVGYTQYVQQIPKQQRRIRSMDTPNTPDHTLDIPAKRWQGLVKAWRVALHKYDPPDLVSTTTRLLQQQVSTDGSVVVAKTPIRCVSAGKQPHHPQYDDSGTASFSPNMDDTTPCSMKSDCASPRLLLDDDDDDVAARNLDFDDIGDDDDDLI